MVSSANPASNYGGAGALCVAAGGLPKGEFQGLLRFDTSAVKTSFDAAFGAGNWQVQGITLQLTAASPNNSIFNSQAAGTFFASWMQNDNWVEGSGTPAAPGATGVTYSSLASLLSANDQSLGGPLSFNGATSGIVSYALTAAPGLVADVAAGQPASLRLFAADSSIAYVLGSRTKAGAEPVLSITAVPEPGTLALLSAAGGALLLWRRGRRP
jgi:hypothetical protein